MARQTEVGIKITAVTTGLQKGVKTAVKGLRGLRKGLELTGKGVEGFGATYRAGIDTIFKSVEVFKSIQGLMTDTVGKFIEASAKFRREGTDPQLKAIKKFKREAERTLGAFGDIFVAMYAGVAKSLKPAIKNLRTFLRTNRELIGTKIVEFVSKLALTFLKVLGPAVNYAYKVFSGLKNIMTLGEAAAAGYTSAIESLYSAIASEQATYAYQKWNDQEKKLIKMRQELGRVWDKTGSKFSEASLKLQAEIEEETKLSKRLKFEYEKQSAAAENAKTSAEKASKASQKAQADAAREILQQEKNVKELEETIAKVSKAIEEGLSKAAIAALEELRKKSKSYATTQEEADKAKEERDKKKEEAARKAAELRKKQHEEELKRIEAEKAAQLALGNTLGSSLGGALKDVISGTKSAGDAMKDLAIQLTQTIAKAAILSAIQSAVKIGTMSAFGGGIASGLASGFLSFNNGGYVPGFNSGGGVDTVAARLTPGEFVLPKGIVDSIRLGKAPPKATYANGGLVSQSASLPAQQVNVTMSTFAVPSKAEFRRWYKSSVVPNTRKMGRRGQL